MVILCRQKALVNEEAISRNQGLFPIFLSLRCSAEHEMCFYVCIYIYMCTDNIPIHVKIDIYIYTCIYIYTYRYTYAHARTHTHTHTNFPISIHICTCASCSTLSNNQGNSVCLGGHACWAAPPNYHFKFRHVPRIREELGYSQLQTTKLPSGWLWFLANITTDSHPIIPHPKFWPPQHHREM